MKDGFISIETVLYNIKNSTGNAFWLKYYSKRSRAFVVKRCLYRAVSGTSTLNKDDTTQVHTGNYSLQGTIPLTDVDNGSPITPKIYSIVGYNDHIVKH